MSATGTPRHPYRALLAVGYASLTFTLAQSMLFPALPALIAGLHTSGNDVAWTITAYFLAAAVATPILGRLGDMFGKRRMVVISMSAFTLGSLVSAASTDLWTLVAGRALTGIGGGVLPLAFSMTRELVPARHVPRAIGILAATTASGIAVGMVVGGVIVDNLSWQWIFWSSAAMGAVAAVALRLVAPESLVKSRGRVDVRGAVVLGVGLVLPLYAISRAAAWGWADPRTLGLIAVGLVVLAGWVQLELHTEEPLANIASLRTPQVLMTNLASLPSGVSAQAMIVLVALIAQAPTSTGYGLGLSATRTGLLLVPGAILSAVSSPLSGAIGARVGSKFPLAFGGFLGALALVYAAFNHASVPQVVIFSALTFAAFGLAATATANLIIGAVPPSITGESIAFNAVIMRVGMSVGVQVSASVVAASALAGSTVPTSGGYRLAFLICAGISLTAGVLALLIPRSARRERLVSGEATGEAKLARTG